MLEAASSFTCTDPSIEVTVAGGPSNLGATLKEELPRLIQIGSEVGSRGIDKLEALAATGAKLKGDIGGVGAKALTCITSGVTLSLAATAKMTHSLKATVQVKGMAGGKLGI